ncbi:unnamed protein product [Moneuplotes crassus]|uniref:Uncharacterized protein n=1 Tax=Euplotes crassus TaxID=5936 RepID=A0AAD2D211_EUPCR|nr:unnamed protein product [Moneuplotes crassus]
MITFCFLCIAWTPFCFESCKDIHHCCEHIGEALLKSDIDAIHSALKDRKIQIIRQKKKHLGD